eukprot:gene8250-8924_t
MNAASLEGPMTRKRSQRQANIKDEEQAKKAKMKTKESEECEIEEEIDIPDFRRVDRPLFQDAEETHDLDLEEDYDWKGIISCFNNVEFILTFNFPSSTVPIPEPTFQLINGKKILYKVRYSFTCLLDFIEMHWNNSRFNSRLHYTGPAGTGKSYNLCALAFYLRKQFQWKQSSRRVFYIPGCKQFFSDKMWNLKVAFSDCFPDEDFSGYRKSKQFIDRMRECEPRSVIFLIDDYDWVLNEPSDPQSIQESRYKELELLEELTSMQLRLVVVAGDCPMWYKSRSHRPNKTSVLEDHPTMTSDEWNFWRVNIPSFNRLSPDDERLLRDFSGDIPLYLYYIYQIMLDHPQWSLETILNHFEGYHYDKGYIRRSLELSTSRFLKNFGPDEFFETMMVAVRESSVYGRYDCFDRRYFHYSWNSSTNRTVLRPVNGYIRKILVPILLKKDKDGIMKSIDEDWVEKALTTKQQNVVSRDSARLK